VPPPGESFPVLFRNVRYVFCDRKRRNFNSGIASLRRELHRVFDFPPLENLIADCEIHVTEAEMASSNLQHFLWRKIRLQKPGFLATKSPPE